jgi:predicted metalloprotease
MVKRIVLVLVAALLVLGLASCGTSGGGDAKGSKGSDEQSDDTKSDDTKSDTNSDDTKSDTNSDDTNSDLNSDGASSDGDITSDDEVDPEVQEFADEMDAVNATAVDFWTQFITDDQGNSTYQAPEQVYQFIGSTDPAPTCGGQETGPENAFYCYPDNSLIYDVEWLFKEYEDIGDTFIYVIIAHEFGHSAQANLNLPHDPQSTELQADCFAGALLQWEIEEGNIELEPGDEEEMNQTLASISNEWGMDELHGTLSQRATAFEFGRTNGAQGCTNEGDYIHWN